MRLFLKYIKEGGGIRNETGPLPQFYDYISISIFFKKVKRSKKNFFHRENLLKTNMLVPRAIVITMTKSGLLLVSKSMIAIISNIKSKRS